MYRHFNTHLLHRIIKVPGKCDHDVEYLAEPQEPFNIGLNAQHKLPTNMSCWVETQLDIKLLKFIMDCFETNGFWFLFLTS